LAAVMGGVMRSPLTGVIFALELTHDWTALLPLTIASAAAYGFSALTLKRSVLTEKVARKGFHLTREYSVDPLEGLLLADVMKRTFTAFQAKLQLSEAIATFVAEHGTSLELQRSQPFYPVLDETQALVGFVTRSELVRAALLGRSSSATLAEIGLRMPAVC